MTEPINPEPSPTPGSSPEPSPQPTPSPTQSHIDGEGNFTEGWEQAYLTEDQKGHGRVVGGRIKNVQGLVASLISADKMISGDKMLKPSDSFGDEDWDAFHAAGGWTNEPIELTAPEGLPEGIWSDDRAKMYSEGFNKLRLNPKQVAGLAELHNAHILQQVTNFKNDSETYMANLKEQLVST